MAVIPQPSMWWVSHADVKILHKENLYCCIDSGAREILSMWKRQREGERKRGKNRRRIGGEVGRAGKKKIVCPTVECMSYGGI